MLSDALQDAGFRTAGFGRATEFEAALRKTAPDVCLVDLGLPDRDGLTLVHRLALESGAAIIIISGRAQVQDRVTGWSLARTITSSSRSNWPRSWPVSAPACASARRLPGQSNTASFAGWTAHFDRYVLEDATGAETGFSHAEGEVLRLFLEAPKRLISRAHMQESLGGAAGESFDRAMDVRISRLRTKLGEDPKNPKLIKTIYGAGYIFLGDVTWR